MSIILKNSRLQNIYDTCTHFCLEIFDHQEGRVYWNVGKGDLFSRFYKSSARPKVASRVYSSHLVYLKKFIRKTITEVRISETSKLVKIKFLSSDDACIKFFWKNNRLMIYIKDDKGLVFNEFFTGNFNDHILDKIDAKDDTFLDSIPLTDIEDWLCNKNKKIWAKSLKKIDRKINKIHNDLNNCCKHVNLPIIIDKYYETKDHRKLYRELKAVGLNVNAELPVRDNINRLYKNRKRLTKAKEKIEGHLSSALQERDEILSLKGIQQEIVQIKIPEFKKVVRKEKRGVVCYKFLDASMVYIGRNSLENIALKKKVANKKDYWFHLYARPSAHIVLKDSDRKLTKEKLSIIASILRDMSGLLDTKITITYTLYQFVRLMSAKKGQVKIENEKILDCFYIENWKEKVTKIEVFL